MAGEDSLARIGKRRLVSWLLVLLLLVGFAPRRCFGATGTTVADPAEDALNKQGVEARRRNDDLAAWEIFRQAYQLHHSPRSAAQIGLAEIALGRWLDAEGHLEEALRAPGDPWIRKNEQVLRDSLERVRNQFGTLHVLGTPAGAEVVVEGKVVGTLPMSAPVRVRTGDCRFEVRAPGYAEIARTVSITASNPTRETVDLAPVSAVSSARPSPAPERAASESHEANRTVPESAETQPPSPSESPEKNLVDASPAGPSNTSIRRVAIIGAAGLAALSLTLGVIEHLSWQNKVSSFDGMAGCYSGLDGKGGAGCQTLYDDGQRARTFAFVGYGLTIGFAATAAILYFTDPARESGSQKIACAVDPMNPGVGCGLRF